MGYGHNWWCDREKTLEALDDDGWMHSGDLVREDQEGFYTVVGRIKEIIITAGGENIAPTNIEEEIKTELEEVVSNVMVVGDGRKYLTALLTLRVTVDPVTLAPTDILDLRAVNWVRAQGGGTRDTLQVSSREEVFSGNGLKLCYYQKENYYTINVVFACV